METSFALLGLLEKEPSYGYDLKRDYDALFGKNKPIAYGQIYATLSRLLRDGQVKTDEPIATEPSGGPERKRYALTSQGRHSLREWLLKPETPKPYMRTTLFAKVVLALLKGQSANDYLDAQRALHLKYMRIAAKQKRENDVLLSLQANYTLFHLEADLRWIDMTAARIEQLKQELL